MNKRRGTFRCARRLERMCGVNIHPLALRVLPCLFSLFLPLAPGCDCGGSTQGKVMGVCGLEGTMIQCVEDEDCEIGTICSEHGECSSEGFCEENGDCREGMLCTDEKHCRSACGVLDDCPDGFVCNRTYCFNERCGKEGICPAGWKIIEGSLFCKPELECPAGTFPGRCGLAGSCIQCITDGDCSVEGEICTEDGRCEAKEPCGPDNRCASFEWCTEEGTCKPSCSFNIDCDQGGICKDRDYCFHERCNSEGKCPDGWRPKEGSIECIVNDCTKLGLVDGKCGLEGYCVECVHDKDCGVSSGKSCNDEGNCLMDANYECSTSTHASPHFDQTIS